MSLTNNRANAGGFHLFQAQNNAFLNYVHSLSCVHPDDLDQ